MGGAIFNHQGELAIENSTLSGNAAIGGTGGTAPSGGSNGAAGQGLGAAIFNLNGQTTLDSATIAFNAADSGGALYDLGYLATDTGDPAGHEYAATATLTNSILANSTGGLDVAANAPATVSGALINAVVAAVTATGPNIVESGAAQITGPPPLTSDPDLGPLAHNDGDTQTHAIAATSPAFDTGETALATDQRGIARPQETADDIGAFELETAKASPTLSTTASAGVVIGGSVSDAATLSGGSAPTGTITFELYGPDATPGAQDADCTGTPAFTSAPIPVAGNGAYGSGSFTPTAVGTYRWTASYSGDTNNEPAASACTAAGESVSVSKASPSLATTASPGIALGAGQLSAGAIVSGRVNPLSGATIDFRLYGPDDATCTGTPAFIWLGVVYPVAGGSVSSPSFTPDEAGTYRWIATYSGDGNNSATSGACDDTDAITVVSKAAPAIWTIASGDAVLGGDPLNATSIVTGRVNPKAGASLDFRLYGPDDDTCAGTPAFESLDVPYGVAGEPASAAQFSPTEPGTYRWRVTYSGDANNGPVTGACNDVDATLEVTKARPAIAGTAAVGIALGGQLTDRAKIIGRVDPAAGDSVDFRLYGPDDPTCAGTPVFESLDRPVSASGTADSAAFTPTQVGTYRWRAFYTGDGHNVAANTECADAEQAVVVTAAPAPAPAPAPTPTSTPSAAPTPSPLPPPRVCRSRRQIFITINPPGARILRATVTNGDSTRRARKTAARKLTVDLRGLPRGRFTVRIVVRLRSGKRRTVTRSYGTCGIPRAMTVTVTA